MVGLNFGPECRDLRYMDLDVIKQKLTCKTKKWLVDDMHESTCQSWGGHRDIME